MDTTTRFAQAQAAWQTAERLVADAALRHIAHVLDTTAPDLPTLLVDETDQDMTGSLVTDINDDDRIGEVVCDELQNDLAEPLSWLDERNKDVWRPMLTDPEATGSLAAPLVFDVAKLRAHAATEAPPLPGDVVDATAKFMVAVYAGDPEAADQYAATLVGLLPDDLVPDGLMATPLTAFASDQELVGWVDGEQFKPVSPDESPDDGPPTWTPVYG